MILLRRPLLPAAWKDTGFEAGEGQQQVPEADPRVSRSLAVEDEGGLQLDGIARSWTEGTEASAQLGWIRPAASLGQQGAGIERKAVRYVPGAEDGGRLPFVPTAGVPHVQQLDSLLAEGVGDPA